MSALDVACPVCKAPVGVRCTDIRGRLTNFAHHQRNAADAEDRTASAIAEWLRAQCEGPSQRAAFGRAWADEIDAGAWRKS